MSNVIKVLIVDDSAFIRYTVAKYLESDPDISVAGNARDGLDALAQMPVLNPDVVILDVEMPRMDGLTTLERIMAEHPVPVIMLSALTQRGASTTIQALMRGALDFVPKPDARVDIRTVTESLRAKIKIAASLRPATLRLPKRSVLSSVVKQGPQLFRTGDPVIVIGASTGGPRALQRVLSELPADLAAAVVVVQHMPPGFTGSLAQRLDEISPLTVREASDGDRLARGLVLLAPGDFHLRFNKTKQVILDNGPRCHYVRPAVDVTMESAAQYHGENVIGVVLTGMGRDGTTGASHIKAAGGKVMAEHESTSVIYGMPASVVKAGLADRIIPLPAVTTNLMEWIHNGRSGV